ncbi:MAG: nucleotidyltransferase domain-containing protein [Catalinimonas sp.]
MPSKEEIPAFLRTHKSAFAAAYGITKLGLFGSFVKGEATADSDLDLMVEFQPGTQSLTEKKARVKFLVSAQFGREVDFCREEYVKTYSKARLLSATIYV